MGVTIRRFWPEDYGAWKRLWAGYLDFYGMTVPEAATRETWRRVRDGQGPVWGFAAEEQPGAVVGLVHYLFHATSTAVGQRCYLQDLYVDPDARGRGAGRALMQAVFAEADTAKADQVYWLTAEDNSAARGLYDRVGSLTSMVKYRNK